MPPQYVAWAVAKVAKAAWALILAVYNNNGLLHSKVLLKMKSPSPPETKEQKIKQESAISPRSLRSISKIILWGLRQLASQHLLCLPDLKCTLACCSWTEKDSRIWSSKDSKVLCMPFRFFTKLMAVEHGCTFSKMINQKCAQKQNPEQESRGLRFIDRIASNMVATMSILNNPRRIQLINTLKWQPELIERGRLMFINLRPHILPAGWFEWKPCKLHQLQHIPMLGIIYNHASCS